MKKGVPSSQADADTLKDRERQSKCKGKTHPSVDAVAAAVAAAGKKAQARTLWPVRTVATHSSSSDAASRSG